MLRQSPHPHLTLEISQITPIISTSESTIEPQVGSPGSRRSARIVLMNRLKRHTGCHPLSWRSDINITDIVEILIHYRRKPRRHILSVHFVGSKNTRKSSIEYPIYGPIKIAQRKSARIIGFIPILRVNILIPGNCSGRLMRPIQRT